MGVYSTCSFNAQRKWSYFLLINVLHPFSQFPPTIGSPSPLDPYDNYFRVRLVCTLLDTCGQYFDRGSGKRKMDCFLVFFQVGNLYSLKFHGAKLQKQF